MRRFAFILMLTALSQSLAAADVTQVINQMEKMEKTLTSIRFQFEQTIEFKEAGTQASAAGEAIFAKPGKMKITKTSPENQVTTSNGKKLWVYSPKNSQVWVGTVKKWTQSNMLPPGLVPLSDYVGELKKNFNLSLDDKKSRPGEVHLKAVPKKDWGYELAFDISEKDWLPNRTTYVSDSGLIVTQMSKREINPSIPAKMFEFAAPQGTDIIQLN